MVKESSVLDEHSGKASVEPDVRGGAVVDCNSVRVVPIAIQDERYHGVVVLLREGAGRISRHIAGDEFEQPRRITVTQHGPRANQPRRTESFTLFPVA
jgi:hypothetical protein